MADPYQQLVEWWRAVRGSHELRDQAQQGWQHVTSGRYTFPVEKAVTRALGLGDVLDYAERRPSELGYPDSGGDEKALRHMLLAAELHRTHPYLANPLLYGHEYVTNVLQGQPLDVRAKDLHNNALGAYIGQRSTSREAAEAWAQTAMPAANRTDYGAPPAQMTREPLNQTVFPSREPLTRPIR